MIGLDYIVIVMLLAINSVSFVLMAIDKKRAQRKAYRIPEKTLLTWCACFGGLGGFLAMHVYRHKTRHEKFTLTIPVMLVLQVALLALYAYQTR